MHHGALGRAPCTLDGLLGPRYRLAEAEVQALKEGHARELRQLRDYIDTLRGYGERMRDEVDKQKAELETLREELRARPPRP